VQGLFEQGNPVRLLNDLAQIHDGNVIAKVLHHPKVMRNKQESEPKLGLQLSQQIQDLRLYGDVQRRNRLIADNQIRLAGKRTGDADTLTLPTGELVRKQSELLGPQANLGKQFRDLSVTFAGIADVHDIHGFANDLAGTHTRIERGKRILEDDLHLPPCFAQPRPVDGADVFSVKDDRSLGRIYQPHDRQGCGGFAGPTLSHKTEGFALRNGKTDAVNSMNARGSTEHAVSADFEMNLQVVDFQEGQSGFSCHVRHHCLPTSMLPGDRRQL